MSGASPVSLLERGVAPLIRVRSTLAACRRKHIARRLTPYLSRPRARPEFSPGRSAGRSRAPVPAAPALPVLLISLSRVTTVETSVIRSKGTVGRGHPPPRLSQSAGIAPFIGLLPDPDSRTGQAAAPARPAIMYWSPRHRHSNAQRCVLGTIVAGTLRERV